MSEPACDVVIVGSGINSLMFAALLAKRGKSVLVLERNAVAGGCTGLGAGSGYLVAQQLAPR